MLIGSVGTMDRCLIDLATQLTIVKIG
jgi:hypothetical protein